MTTTELIEMLKRVEFGASGRPREITFRTYDSQDNDFFHFYNVEITGSGDGIAGAELTLDIT